LKRKQVEGKINLKAGLREQLKSGETREVADML